jgi:hypothetical protein
MQNRFPFLEQQTFSKAHIDTIGSTATLRQAQGDNNP